MAILGNNQKPVKNRVVLRYFPINWAFFTFLSVFNVPPVCCHYACNLPKNWATIGNMNIYPTKIRNEKKWVADMGRINGHRKRRFFDTKAQAKAAIDDSLLERKTAGDVWVGLSSSERLEAAHVLLEAKRRGLTMRQVWDDFLRMSEDVPTEIVTLDKAIAVCCQAKTDANLRPRYVKTLRYGLEKFARGRETMPIHQVTLKTIKEWISAISVVSTKRTASRHIGTLFSFALRQQWVRENPIKQLEPIRVDQETPEILTVRQSARVILWTQKNRPDLLAYVALALFAGVRPMEILGISWNDVKLDDGVVVVDSAASKTRQRRIVHLQPAALEWLIVAKKLGSTLPMLEEHFADILPELARFLGFDRWPHDVMRHTAASNLITLTQDAGAVALELGNSVAILLRHYRELVTRKDAARFWALRPGRRLTAEGSPAGNTRTLPSSNPKRQPAKS